MQDITPSDKNQNRKLSHVIQVRPIAPDSIRTIAPDLGVKERLCRPEWVRVRWEEVTVGRQVHMVKSEDTILLPSTQWWVLQKKSRWVGGSEPALKRFKGKHCDAIIGLYSYYHNRDYLYRSARKPYCQYQSPAFAL